MWSISVERSTSYRHIVDGQFIFSRLRSDRVRLVSLQSVRHQRQHDYIDVPS